MVQKKSNAYWRKVETEDARQHINDVKRSLKETQTNLKEEQTRVTNLTAAVENESDSTIRRELKIQLKITETSVTDL